VGFGLYSAGCGYRPMTNDGEHGNELSGSSKDGEFLDCLNENVCSKRTLISGVIL
jgi:hypothetical protein